jgi:hypothetical protein
MEIDMRKKSELNCPNCGAPITGEYCPYCGSVFYDWAALNANEPKYIKFKIGDKVVMAKAIMKHYALDYDSNPVSLFADNKVVATMMAPPTATITTEFEVIPDDDGIMYRVIDERRFGLGDSIH